MAWFKKKEEPTIEEEVPELPELPEPDEFSLPDLPEAQQSSKNMPKLPELPELRTENVMHSEVIRPEKKKQMPEMQKSQFKIIEHKERQEPQFGIMSSRPRPQPMPRRIQEPPEFSQGFYQEPQEMIREEPELPPAQTLPPTKPVKTTEPVYVRLDKFESSVQAIEEIKRKIMDIESILKKIKDVKQREDQELEAWEREIHVVKSRIDAIDKTVFNKLG